MEGLLNAETGVARFGNHLFKIYGNATDPEFTTNLLECVIEYELGFRNALCNELMKRNINHNFVQDLKIELQDLIDIVCMFRDFNQQDKETFHLGRKFINYVKHNNLNAFASVEEAVEKFSKAYHLMTAHGLVLI